VLRDLDEARERSGLTKAALAVRAELPEASIRKLFTSQTANPSLKTLSRLARALGLRVALVPKSSVPGPDPVDDVAGASEPPL
jgi:transcriptional regulator with XRE-family HTH domain